jgi:hypothetical protein
MSGAGCTAAACGLMAPARRREGEGKKAGDGPYHNTKLRRRLAGEERRQSGGPTMRPSSSGGGELGLRFAGHETAAATLRGQRHGGDAIYGAAEGDLSERAQACGEACHGRTRARVRAWHEVEEGSNGRTPPGGERAGRGEGGGGDGLGPEGELGRLGCAGGKREREKTGRLGWAVREEKRGRREKGRKRKREI